jgi:hypothetical protein
MLVVYFLSGGGHHGFHIPFFDLDAHKELVEYSILQVITDSPMNFIERLALRICRPVWL